MSRMKASVLPWCGVAERRRRCLADRARGAAEGVAGDLPVGAGEFVGLVDDDEVPSGLL